MTEAYMIGFCKTAEAYGVDPDRLVKAAQAAALFRGLKGLGNALGTTGWLGARTVASGAGQLARRVAPAAQKAMHGVRNAGRTLRSDFMRGFKPNGPAMGIPKPKVPSWMKSYLDNPALRGVKIPTRVRPVVPGLA